MSNKNRKDSQNKNKSKFFLKEYVEDNFLYNDSLAATAGKFLLASLVAGPIIVTGAIVPGMFSATKKFASQRKKYTKKQIQAAYHNFKKRKLVEIIQEKNGKTKVKLTNLGQKRIKEFCFEIMKIEKPGHWDGKWRVLIFDIPSYPKIYNNAREALRRKIKELGFYQLQKSVWVYPYECEDEILFVAEIFEVQEHIEILTVEKFLHEKKLKSVFHL